MIGTCRVRSLPRISSASSKPSMSGICTSSSARATSWHKQQFERFGAGAGLEELHVVAPQAAPTAPAGSPRGHRRADISPLSGHGGHDLRDEDRSSPRSRSRDLRQRQHDHRPGRASRRPPASAATAALARLLHDGQPPARRTASSPARAVLVGAGQNDADQSIAIAVRGRFEQHVDRRAREMHRLVGGERQYRGPSSTSR